MQLYGSRGWGAKIAPLSDGLRFSFSNRRSCDCYKFVGDQASTAESGAPSTPGRLSSAAASSGTTLPPYWIETASAATFPKICPNRARSTACASWTCCGVAWCWALPIAPDRLVGDADAA